VRGVVRTWARSCGRWGLIISAEDRAVVLDADCPEEDRADQRQEPGDDGPDDAVLGGHLTAGEHADDDGDEEDEVSDGQGHPAAPEEEENAEDAEDATGDRGGGFLA